MTSPYLYMPLELDGSSLQCFTGVSMITHDSNIRPTVEAHVFKLYHECEEVVDRVNVAKG